MPKAVIFDLDGVLIDSERQSVLLNRDFLREQGVEPPMKELLALVGTTDFENYRYMARALGVGIEEARDRLDRFFSQKPMRGPEIRKPGALEFLVFLREAGIPMALATNSPMDFVDRILSECAIGEFFSHVVSGRSLPKPKPDPGIYLHTMGLMGFSPRDLLVVEDSPAGIAAARGAKIPVAGLRDPLLGLDLTGADYLVETFEELKTIVIKETPP